MRRIGQALEEARPWGPQVARASSLGAGDACVTNFNSDLKERARDLLEPECLAEGSAILRR